MQKEKLQQILQKASEYEKSMPISLAKSFIALEEAISAIKIPEPTDLTEIKQSIQELKDETIEVDLIIE
jgi:hypothetical protein